MLALTKRFISSWEIQTSWKEGVWELPSSWRIFPGLYHTCRCRCPCMDPPLPMCARISVQMQIVLTSTMFAHPERSKNWTLHSSRGQKSPEKVWPCITFLGFCYSLCLAVLMYFKQRRERCLRLTVRETNHFFFRKISYFPCLKNRKYKKCVKRGSD